VRVFFSNHSTAPINLGGAERSLLQLVEDWTASRPDFEPFFVTKAPAGKFIEALRQRGWPFTAYRFRGWALPSPQPAPVAERTAFAAADYAAVTAMIELFEREKPDLVVTNTLVAPWAAFAAKTLGIPHAWFVREYGDLDHGLQFQLGRDATFHDIGLLSEAVVTNSDAVAHHLSSSIDPAKITVAYPQIDTAGVLARAAVALAISPFPQDDPGLKITVVGRVEEGKGQHRVIRALGELRTRGVMASLALAGAWKEPGYDLELRRLARELGVEDSVTILGELDNPFAVAAAADVCVTPSTIEAFGRSTLEYMTVGRPVVASETGGSAELVTPGVTGALFHPDDVGALADALEAYARNPELVREHGEAARQRAAEISAGSLGNEALIERLEALVGAPAYRLPEMARYWFALPPAYASLGATTPRMFLGLVASRVRSRTGLVGRVLRRPGVALARLRRT
jgi:glycosyltransferase involved in cell wall biosynthesis